MKKTGFTLIELLAVIVILAIIALIATPTILGVIEKARIGAAKSSALGYIDAVEKQVSIGMVTGEEIIDGTYEVKDLNVSYKGEKIGEGTVVITKGQVKKSLLKIDNYYTCYLNNKVIVNKDKTELTNCSDITNADEAETYPTVLEKAKTLVYAADGQTCKIDADSNDTTTYKYMGGCYIKGASTNNYVWYNGFMWRIMGINSDNTVRLITDENVTALAYGPSNSGLTYEENEGYIHDWLNEYFYNHLNSTKSIIQNGTYFCSESTNSEEGRTTCTEGNEVTTQVGLISLDEYLLSGEKSSYLNIKQWSWTMTPYDATGAWCVNDNGRAGDDGVTIANGVRPVINVSSTTFITAGDGTAQNFYVLEENKNTSVTGTISEIVTSGEYVNLEGHTYRVVRKEINQNNEITGIKLILDGFYEETEGTPYTMKYNETTGDNVFVLTSGIGAKLNGIAGDNGKNVITWLGLSNSDKIINTTYYQGSGFGTGSNYQTTLEESNGIQTKVGLIQVGDILASQSSTMLTKNYATTSSNTKTYWTINKTDAATSAWRVADDGYVSSGGVTNAGGVRPVITVIPSLPITGGNGTWKTPYEI